MRNTSQIERVRHAAARVVRPMIKRSWLITTGAVLGLASGPALGELPSGHHFSVGSGWVDNTPGGHQTVWMNGSTALINWNSFNIGSGNSVHFQSTSDPNFRVLNKTSQWGPSMIHGQLTGSGTIGLINPAGVVFMQNSVVNVGSFLAASGSLLDESAFLNNSADGYTVRCGNGNINILPGATITASDTIGLIGRSVTNRGSLIAPTIVMVGGLLNNDDVTVKNLGDVISLRINGEDLSMDAEDNDDFHQPTDGVETPSHLGSRGIHNSGDINGTKHIAMAAGDLFGHAIHNTGLISGNGGRVDAVALSGLVKNDGTIESTGSDGGRVRIAAPVIVNMDGSSIAADANSDDGNAGEVFLHSNLATILQTGSQISTNARMTGTGGFITTQSDGVQIIENAATLTSRAGTFDGDAGYVRISGDKVSVDGSLKASMGSQNDNPLGLGTISIVSQDNMDVVDNVSAVAYSLDDLSNVTCGRSEVAVNTSLAYIDANLTLETPEAALTFYTDLHINPVTNNYRILGGLGMNTKNGIYLAHADQTRISANKFIRSVGNIEMANGFYSGLLMHAGTGMQITGNIGEAAPIKDVGLAAGGFIKFGSNSLDPGTNMIHAVDNIVLNGDGNQWLEQHGTATISIFSDTFDINSLNGNVRFGPMQAMSTAGDLSISAAQQITVGDLNVSGDLALAAPQIEILLRPAVTVTSALGTAESLGTSIIANGDIDFSVTPNYDLTEGNAPVFASANGPATTGTLASQEWGEIDDVNLADLEVIFQNQNLLGLLVAEAIVPPPGPGPDPGPDPGPGPAPDPGPNPAPTPSPVPNPVVPVLPIDAVVDAGLANNEVATANDFTDAIAAESQIFPAEQEVSAPPEGNSAPLGVSLADLGIEVVAIPNGQRQSVVNDFAADIQDGPGGVNTSVVKINQQRLDNSAAKAAVKQFESVLTSQPDMTSQKIAERDMAPMATAFSQAFAEYRSSDSDAPDSNFASWLSSSGSNPQAEAYMSGMQQTFQDLASAGLNPAEVSNSSRFVANNILGGTADTGITPADLAGAMASSSK